VFVVGCGSSNHPTDSVLIRNFQKNEDAFQKLVQMSNNDSNVIRIAYDFTRLETTWAWPRPESQLGFSKERWTDYRKLFKKLGLEAGLERANTSNGVVIFLVASAKGLSVSGSSKGYIYSGQPLSPLVESLDVVPPTETQHRARYKMITNHWYLCHEW
jgi:hypothetical protein